MSKITKYMPMQEALEESKHFTHAALDTLSAHLAILDENGTILMVNRAWRDFALTNAGETVNLCEGVNYLTVIDAANGTNSEEAAAFAAGLRSVLHGEQNEFMLEYPCHSPGEKRWFIGRVTRFNNQGIVYLVIAHENITERKLKEEEIKRLNMVLEQQVIERTDDLANANGLLEEKIIELEQAQEALKEANKFNIEIINNTNTGILVYDLQMRCLFWNPFMEKLTGIPAVEVLGENLIDTLPFLRENSVIQLVERAMAGETAGSLDIFYHFANGNSGWGSATYAPRHDTSGNRIGAIVFVSDINVRKSAEKALQESYEKLQLLFDLLPVGVSVLDKEQRVVKMNPAMENILGITSEGFSAGKFKNRRYFRPDGSRMPVEEFASTRAFNGETQVSNIETGVEKEDGSMVWTDVSAVAGQFEDWNTVIVTTDITAHKQAEEEIHNHIARTETLVRTGALLAAHLDLKNMLQTVCLEVARVLKAPAANIFLSDARDVELTLAGSFGLPMDFLQRNQSLPITLIEQIAVRLGIDRIGVIPIAQFLDQSNIQLFSKMGMQSVMTVKIIHDQKLVGLLSVFSPDEATHFSTGDHVLLLGLADQIAQAVVNIRLFEQVNAGQQRLRNLSQALIDMEENERRSLALELHDQLGQMLSTVKMSLDMIPALPQEDADEQIQRASQLVSDMIARVRHMALDLRPSILDDRGLLPALLYLFKSFQTQSGEAVTFKHNGLELRFPPKVEITAYRIIQEALTNVLRHAGKSQVEVHAWADEQSLNLQIQDFGVGFNPAIVQSKGVSNGLSGMRERSRLLGGELVIESTPGKGTTVTAMLPVMLIQENV